MNSSPYKVVVNLSQNKHDVYKGVWLAILHVSRIPPHIGIVIDGNYNSLTIKGHELSVDISILLKTIAIKKIETVFIPLKKHPVFSASYQLEILQLYIKQFKQVSEDNTCLTPVKLFLQEFYAIPFSENELLFELIERLKQNNYIAEAVTINTAHLINNSSEIHLPIYNSQQLKNTIQSELDQLPKH